MNTIIVEIKKIKLPDKTYRHTIAAFVGDEYFEADMAPNSLDPSINYWRCFLDLIVTKKVSKRSAKTKSSE